MTIYIYEAIKRKKENPNNVGERCIREVSYDVVGKRAIDELKKKTSNDVVIWRIYRTVNSRDARKAQIDLAKTLIDILSGVNDTKKTVENLWKDILSQPRNKAERKFLVDVDSACLVNKVSKIIRDCGRGLLLDTVATPNGFHLITLPFDPRIMKDSLTTEEFANVEIKKDALVFVEKYKVR